MLLCGAALLTERLWLHCQAGLGHWTSCLRSWHWSNWRGLGRHSRSHSCSSTMILITPSCWTSWMTARTGALWLQGKWRHFGRFVMGIMKPWSTWQSSTVFLLPREITKCHHHWSSTELNTPRVDVGSFSLDLSLFFFSLLPFWSSSAQNRFSLLQFLQVLWADHIKPLEATFRSKWWWWMQSKFAWDYCLCLSRKHLIMLSHSL